MDQSLPKVYLPLPSCAGGHAEAANAQRLIEQAQLVEAGATLTLADASTLTSNNSLFPSSPLVAVEKLYGWSIVIDVFHGPTHPMAEAISTTVERLGPLLQRMVLSMADHAMGMDLICRIMFELQQEYFLWVDATASGLAPAIPTFDRLIQLVSSHRASSLAALPHSWYLLPGAPKKEQPPASPAPSQGTHGSGGSSASVVNAHANEAIKRRFKDSGHSTIGSMMQGHTVDIPKHANKPICLAWALRGSCHSNCKRAAQHVRYGNATITAINAMLDTCGVAASQ